MKNLVSILIIVCSILFVSPTQIVYAKVQTSQSQKKEVTVYITKTGAKYHRGSCGYLRKSKIAITKKDSIANCYSACSRCTP